MAHLKKAYPGRLIFDHLPKTAGMAINSWLVSELGDGCVTPTIVGEHSDLIRRYGGSYSVISAHVRFNDGEGLDSRYQYMTCFRDPVDRVVSWLFFVNGNFDDLQLPVLRKNVVSFLDGENAPLARYVSNAYVEHFCRIEGNGSESDDQKIINALSAIKKYDVVGLYGEMPQFMADVSSLIGLPKLEKLPSVNVTHQRPQVMELSPALRKRINDLNQLDILLYEEVVAWKKTSKPKESFENKSSHIKFEWEKRKKTPDRIISKPEIKVSSVFLREGKDIERGQMMTLEMDIFLGRKISNLEIGIHIFDGNGKIAFQTNSTFLRQPYLSVDSAYYHMVAHIGADLPAGRYTVGFSFVEKLPEEENELFWHDRMCEFEVLRPADKTFGGYCHLPAGISLIHTKPAMAQVVVTQHTGSIKTLLPLKQLTTGDLFTIAVEVLNNSDQVWLGDVFFPIKLSYHWLNESGNMVLFDGLRTAIPINGLFPKTPCETEMKIQAPNEPGVYILVLTLVQEAVGWFEERGFEPARVAVNIQSAHV